MAFPRINGVSEPVIFMKSLIPDFKKYEAKLKKNITAALKILKKEKSVVSFFLVDDASIQALNKKFRKKNKPTNVLSFKEPDFFPHPELASKSAKFLGEIYLAPFYIERKQENIDHLAVHGVLHLLGYTHQGKNDKILMERKEKMILSNLESRNGF